MSVQRGGDVDAGSADFVEVKMSETDADYKVVWPEEGTGGEAVSL